MMVASLLAGLVQRALPASCAALAVALTATPVAAQATAADECAGTASAAEEIACLREALEQSRRALGRAGAGEAIEPPSVVEDRAPAVPAAQAAAQLRNMGAEQVVRGPDRVREPARSPERVVGTITAARADARGLLMVRLDNGQIWQQTEQASVPVSIDEDERNTVEISRSGFGGYRMHLQEMGRTMVVKRVE